MIRDGDKFIAIQDVSFIKKDEVVTLVEVGCPAGSFYEVYFAEYINDTSNPEFQRSWGFPHPCFFRINDTDVLPMRKEFNQYDEFDKITVEMATTYRAKNADYGDSFAKSIQKRGLISAVTRIEDKFQRMDNIISTGKVEVKSESLEDTLLDMANYAIMTVIEIRRNKNK